MREDAVIVIFGCSAIGKQIYEEILETYANCEVCFMDNSTRCQEEGFCGKTVYGVGRIKELGDKAYYIVASGNYYREIVEQLKSYDIQEHRIVIPKQVWEFQINALQQQAKKWIPEKTLKFEIQLAEHCNLNCQNCDHFSPLAEESFLDIKEYEKDLKRLKDLFEDKVSRIELDGGEPLLNPDIEEFLRVTHFYFPKAHISVLTNGLLLLKMSDAFWNLCSEFGIVIELTKYPIALDYDKIENIAKEKNVDLRYFNSAAVTKTSNHFPLDLDGKQDKWENFCECYHANRCVMLKHGKLYTCTVIPNMEHFNQYFNKDIPVTERDFIDIHSDVTAQDILEFLAHPVPACSYCKVKERTANHAWRQSRKEICEWT